MGADIKQGMRNSVERGFYLARSAPTGYKIVHVKDGGEYRPKLELDPLGTKSHAAFLTWPFLISASKQLPSNSTRKARAPATASC